MSDSIDVEALAADYCDRWFRRAWDGVHDDIRKMCLEIAEWHIHWFNQQLIEGKRFESMEQVLRVSHKLPAGTFLKSEDGKDITNGFYELFRIKGPET